MLAFKHVSRFLVLRLFVPVIVVLQRIIREGKSVRRHGKEKLPGAYNRTLWKLLLTVPKIRRAIFKVSYAFANRKIGI